MDHRGRQEAYQAFVQLVRSENQAQRSAVNRRMASVVLWCFIAPAILSVLATALIRAGVFVTRLRLVVEWAFLICPIAYSVYFLVTEALKDVPDLLRYGGISASLRSFEAEGRWRESTAEKMKRLIGVRRDDWVWIVASFRIDLRALRQRTAFITGLAGAVLFMIVQGLDLLTEEEMARTYIRDQRFGWLEVVTGDSGQWSGLVLFLILFFLSGLQNTNSLARYLDCAELVLSELDS